MPSTPTDSTPERQKADTVPWQWSVAGALTALLLAGGGYFWLAERNPRRAQAVTIATSSPPESRVRPATAVPPPPSSSPVSVPDPEPPPPKAAPAIPVEKHRKVIPKVPPLQATPYNAPEPLPVPEPIPIPPEIPKEPPKIFITPHTVAPNPPVQLTPPRPAKYSGPLAGDMTWSAQVKKGEIVDIQGGRPSSGTLNGLPFPGGVPVSVSINNDKFAVISQPNPLNQFSKISFRSEMNGRIVLTIHWQVLPH